MNKTRKSFLTASSIITIVASALAILLSFGIAFLAGEMKESIFKETFQDDPLYTYYDDPNGDYYFSYTDEDGVVQTLDANDIKMIAKVAEVMIGVVAFGTFAISCAKLTVSIIVLINSTKNKYKKGMVITLLVLNILTTSVLEIIFLALAMASSDKQQHSVPIIENNNSDDEIENN